VTHPYPHVYTASASGTQVGGPVTVNSKELPSFETAPPPEFGGPTGFWSPETLLCASLADCFILTFRAIARAARFEWGQLECSVDGRLERDEGTTRFTRFTTKARLTVGPDADTQKARILLEQAEHRCLIANSLQSARHLEADVVIAESAEAAGRESKHSAPK
jgi:organic hydroperoxide reductase OsmC/OhrA